MSAPADVLAGGRGAVEREHVLRLEQVLAALHLLVGDRRAQVLPAHVIIYEHCLSVA